MKRNIYLIIILSLLFSNSYSQVLSLYSKEAAEYKSMSVEPIFRKVKTAFHINTEENDFYIVMYLDNDKSKSTTTKFKYKQTKNGSTDEYCEVDSNGNVKQDYCVSIDWITKKAWLFSFRNGKRSTSIFKLLEPPIDKSEW